MYQARGLTVCDVHGDHEFGCIRESLRPIGLHGVPADSHVGEVERSIRTVKERLRSCAHGLPFKRLPRLLVQYMVADTIRCLNQFPWPNGISATMSPATSIVTGVGTPDYNCMRIEFGAYAQVFEGNSPSNTLRARSLGALALTPTGNAQGDYFFLSLATGSRLSRHQWTELPMTDTAIARAEALAQHENQPLIQTSGLVVEWRPDQSIDVSEYDRDYVPPAPLPHTFLKPTPTTPSTTKKLMTSSSTTHMPRWPTPRTKERRTTTTSLTMTIATTPMTEEQGTPITSLTRMKMRTTGSTTTFHMTLSITFLLLEMEQKTTKERNTSKMKERNTSKTKECNATKTKERNSTQRRLPF